MDLVSLPQESFCDDYIFLLIATTNFSIFPPLTTQVLRFLSIFPFPKYKKRSIQDARKWKNSFTFDQKNFALFKKSTKVCIPRVEMGRLSFYLSLKSSSYNCRLERSSLFWRIILNNRNIWNKTSTGTWLLCSVTISWITVRSCFPSRKVSCAGL